MPEAIKYKDAETFLLFKQGDKSAFAKYFNGIYSTLVNYSYSIVENEEDASEIAADALIYVDQNRSKIDGPDHLYAFLFKFVHNKTLDAGKKKTVYKKKEKRYFEELNEIPYVEKESSYNIEELKNALNSLPLIAQTVINHLVVEKVSYKELAEKLQVTADDLGNIRALGLRRMKKFLKANKPKNIN